ncbi:hypothetical protein D3C74_350620 [compost metagenome]
MFLKGYLNTKKESQKKELDFRSELTALIKSKSSITEDIETYIMTLPLKNLALFLEEHTLLHFDAFNQLQKKYFG